MRPFTFRDYKEQYTKGPNGASIQLKEDQEYMLWVEYTEYMKKMYRDYPR